MTKTFSKQDLAKLAKEAKALSEWTKVHDWSAQIYGEGKAVKVEIDTHGEYNDEGGTNYYIEDLRAYASSGEELTPDYSLPFFQTKAWKDAVNYYKDDEEEESFLKMIKETYMDEEESARFVDFDDLPVEDTTYDLTSPPTLTLPTQEAST